MVASHDSMTYSEVKNKIYKLFSGIWKTQELPLIAQYKKVRYFDIRIYKDRKHKWRTCHGKVDFIYTFDTIEDLCEEMKSRFPEAYFRIILEKYKDEDEVWDFMEEVSCLKYYNKLDWIIIKKDWKILKAGKLKYVDYTCKLNTFKEIIGMIKYGFSIKKWAKKNNPEITEEMINDPKTVYFFDFVNL